MSSRFIVAAIGSVALLWHPSESVRCGAEQPLSGASHGPNEPPFDQADKLVHRQRELGHQLVGILSNAKQPLRLRARSAELLARIHYLPAIPVLIRHIALVHPDKVVDSDDWTMLLPSVQALQRYGDAAVPSIVREFLKEEDRTRQLQLALAIAPKSRKTAVVYALGLSAHEGKHIPSESLNRFLQYMKE